jgi:predicted dehydrogenase
MIKTALVGLGKMGLSHLALLRAHPQVDLCAICDSSGFMLDGIRKFTQLETYSDYRRLLSAEAGLEAIVIATPSRFHADIVRDALQKGIHVFCEKPFCLDPSESLALADLAEANGLVNQVGYHYRFVGAFQETKRLIEAGAIGRIHHLRGEAYGPVVLRPKGGTWRSHKNEGGGCLYDYASHVIDLMNYLVGAPSSVSGSVLNQIFSAGVDDEVYSTFRYPGGASAQLAANWSDESVRKMSVKVTLNGEHGRIQADRQEVQIYLRDQALAESVGLSKGWNVRYTTELTDEVWFYLRGEEYSAQIAHFVDRVANGGQTISSFRTAAETDRIVGEILADAAGGPQTGGRHLTREAGARKRLRSMFTIGN